MHKKKYSSKDFYRDIYSFHTFKDKRQTNITEVTGIGTGFVSKALTKYFELGLNLNELAINSLSEECFTKICLKHDKLKEKT